ncbi:formimidoylglutamate deiminase [Paracraurococcus ruber]|uniref:formimidoylglutamate deiminase n=1 Tax=Paracraurococcus ruber TaxID=77675 RepID=UPI00130511C2
MRSLPRLRALLAFDAAARHGRFVAAAAEPHVTPAAIGQQVRGLEAALGVRLFVRRPHGTARLVPTEDARAALRDIAEGFDNLEAGLRRLGGRVPRAVVVVTASHALAARWLLPELPDFAQGHPGVDVRLDITDRLLDLAQGEADLGLRCGPGGWPGVPRRRGSPLWENGQGRRPARRPAGQNRQTPCAGCRKKRKIQRPARIGPQRTRRARAGPGGWRRRQRPGHHAAMPHFHARAALLPEGWAEDVLIEADAAGRIAAVTPGAAPAAADRLRGAVIPGVPNLHSHAFQRAMAGGAERRSPDGQDSFWTWRETMYRFVGRFSPEDAEAVAAQLYAECLEWGFTSIAEFHYLHHQPDGTSYAAPAEMALRHLAAARRTGIGITLLPSLYRHGGIFGRDPAPGQRRFLNDLDPYLRILGDCRAAVAGDPQAAVGMAPHSLRAVTPAMLQAVVAEAGPIHIHAAEQEKEVAECLAATGARPVQWLLDNAPLDARWCLIHATHMTAAETAALAARGAAAGLCPSTEASLGDGTFPLRGWLAAGGRFGVGTDSHVGTSPRDELRQLETSQRLALWERAVATTATAPHPGRRLLDAALAGGAQASGRAIGAIAPGRRCDLVELDDGHPSLLGRSGDSLLDAWVFAGQANPVRTAIVGGKRVVEGGRHVARLTIGEAFAGAMRRLLG